MSRPPLVTLRATAPPMGESDGNTALVRLVESRWAGLEEDGVYGPRDRNAVANWQWRVGAPNFRGAITPAELQVLLGYRKRPKDWVRRAKQRAGTPSPHTPEPVDERPALEFIPAEVWNPLTPRNAHAVARWYEGIPHVVHWFGPGAVAAGGDDQELEQLRGFARYHQERLRWNYFAYSLAILTSGKVAMGRGPNVRTAATGNNTGNGYPSVLLMAGVDTPNPTDAQLATLQALRAHYGWGRRLKHSELNSTACPGPSISAWVQIHR